MGGEIWVESEKNAGAAFFFTSPYVASNRQMDYNGEFDEDFDENKNIAILIAEDEHFNFIYLQALLNEGGYRIIHAENGQRAVELLEEDGNVDLILMNIGMPVMDGFEAVEVIRKTNAIIPIIAQSAYTMEEDKQKALELGFDDSLEKPIRRDVLTKVVKKHLNKVIG